MLSKSFVRGYGSVIALCSTSDDSEMTVKVLSDEEAVEQDWQTVGKDMWLAITSNSAELTNEINTSQDCSNEPKAK